MTKHRTRESLKTLDCIDEQLGRMRVRFKENTGDEKAAQVESITDFLWNAHDTEFEHPGTIKTCELSYNTNGLTVNLQSISDQNETFLNIRLISSTGQVVNAYETPKQGDQLQLLFSQTNGEIEALVSSCQVEKNQITTSLGMKKKLGH